MRSGADLPAIETADRAALDRHQSERLARLLVDIHGPNPFYTKRLDECGVVPSRFRFPEDLPKLPLTTKAELVAEQERTPPWGTDLTEPLDAYSRYCQTSSTTGSPLRWVDTPASWQWMLDCWKVVLRAAGVDASDRIFFPFSFGPFLGFWTAFEAACQIGAQSIPGGGMSSQVRLRLIETLRPTVICCTPTYALWLAEVASADPETPPLREGSVRLLIVAGEPGGSIPATRGRIEMEWGARVIDHHGLTETGPLSFECLENPGGMHVNEGEYIAEVLDPAGHEPVADGQRGELVVTNLGRTASPVLRYRTGDMVVRSSGPCRCGRTWARLEGGILARADDMINVRGVNVYPAAIESVVRRFPEVVEFRSTASRTGAMWSLKVEIEPASGVDGTDALCDRLARLLREALGLNVPVASVSSGTLPRFEMKARRFVVEGSP
jgi:phenylacetate-CoA ligase